MKDLTEQIYDELNAQVVRMLNHSLAQASRIVELETQLKDHSAQAFSIGETYANALSRIAELEAQLEEAETLISQTSHGAAERISAMEAQLAAASAPADTDKLRELRARIYEMKEAAYTYGDNSKEAVCAALDGVLDEIDEAASTALQAPVREVPGWISVDEQLPEKRDRPYQVIAVCKKTYAEGTNYAGQGIKEVYQDWVIREWPGNYAYWSPLPAAPVQQEGA